MMIVMFMMNGVTSYKGKRTGKMFRLGDPVKVNVVRVDREKREIDFVLA